MTRYILRLFFVMITALVLAPYYAANDIYITQVGDNLDLDITQDGTDNVVGNSTTAAVINGDGMTFAITQQGNYNIIEATIRGANYTGAWTFNGSSNTVNLDCSSSAAGNCDDVTLNIAATGDGNAFTFDIGESADASTAVVNFTVTGDNSIINSTVNGTNAALTVVLDNSASLATTSAASNEGVAITTVQTGNGTTGHGIDVNVTGGGGTIDINQSGLNDQTVDLDIQGDNFDIDINQSD